MIFQKKSEVINSRILWKFHGSFSERIWKHFWRYIPQKYLKKISESYAGIDIFFRLISRASYLVSNWSILDDTIDWMFRGQWKMSGCLSQSQLKVSVDIETSQHCIRKFQGRSRGFQKVLEDLGCFRESQRVSEGYTRTSFYAGCIWCIFNLCTFLCPVHGPLNESSGVSVEYQEISEAFQGVSKVIRRF